MVWLLLEQQQLHLEFYFHLHFLKVIQTHTYTETIAHTHSPGYKCVGTLCQTVEQSINEKSVKPAIIRTFPDCVCVYFDRCPHKWCRHRRNLKTNFILTSFCRSSSILRVQFATAALNISAQVTLRKHTKYTKLHKTYADFLLKMPWFSSSVLKLNSFGRIFLIFSHKPLSLLLI